MFYCLNLGEVTSNHGHVGAMVGNGFKFSEQKSYYTNCERSSENNEATNFTEAGMSIQEVAEQMGSNFKYENGSIYLNFEDYTPDEADGNIKSETFSNAVPEKNVTMPAPEISCNLLTHYFGTVIDKDNVSINCSGVDGAEYWHIDIAADPDFTDIYMQSGSSSLTAYNLVPGVTYYVRAQGKTASDTTSADCKYTEYGYLNVILSDYGSLITFDGELGYIPGDISGNYKIDLYDAIEICKSIMGMRTFTDDEKAIADYDGNGVVDLYDAIGIAKKLLEK